MKHFDYAGSPHRVSLDAGALFFVPDDTLVHAEADALGVRSAKDLFGGIVPHPFVKTKVISHGVLAPAAARPRGWSHAFADRIRDVVLPGYSAFARADARAAASRLLELGAIRAKPPRAAGGNGQSTLASMAEVEALLETLTDAHLDRHGLVLELCLQPVTTLSVGHVALDDTTIAYYGHQRLTRDNSGHMVYGGSDLTCVRGGWETLEGLALESDVRTAIRQARVYDEATLEYGVAASRRNYDVGQGLDSAGRRRSGVFEASWRVGGASAAEVAALEAFARDPSIALVDASTVEAYGADVALPPGAIVHFHGVDRDAGALARYSLVRETPRRRA